MKLNIEITPEIAECVGLWLAEGDTKTKSEITFTNNCSTLVEFFAKTIQQIFKNYDFRPRVYVYSAELEKIKLNFICKINYYNDQRARKPYFIYRVGSVNLNSIWKNTVRETEINKKFYKYILRGFFAGEGNLKDGSHHNRTVRIAQGKPNKLMEQILALYKITYQYKQNERAYVITGKWNWDKLAKIKIADLHPIKKEKFWKIYNSYIEEHFPAHYIKEKMLKLMDKPYTSLELSKSFKRSPARIYDILSILKKQNILQLFKVRSKSYWIKTDQNKIIISSIKDKYLKSLEKEEKTTGDLAREIGVCWKSAYNRLRELEKLCLASKNSNGLWKIITTTKEVIVL